MALSAVLGDLTWAIAALLAAIVFGYRLLAHLRRQRVLAQPENPGNRIAKTRS
jgi:hypothetical protein